MQRPFNFMIWVLIAGGAGAFFLLPHNMAAFWIGMGFLGLALFVYVASYVVRRKLNG